MKRARYICLSLIVFVASSASLAFEMPLSASLLFPDIPLAAITGVEAVVRNPAALQLNRDPAISGYHSFAEGDFSGDKAVLISTNGIGFSYQRIGLSVPAGVSRYDFAASTRWLKNLYAGLSYTYYKTDWEAINRAHSWNASVLYHGGRRFATAIRLQNLNKHRFSDEESSIVYTGSVALRPFAEKLTVGGDFTFHHDQRIMDGNWRISLRGAVKRGLQVFAGYDNLGHFGAGIELSFGRSHLGGESFFNNKSKYNRSTIYTGTTATEKERLISPRPRILHLNISGELPEQPVRTFLSRRPRPTVFQTLQRLRDAKDDPSITGLLLTINSPSSGWARLAEVRDACAHFKQAGKPVIAYLGPLSGNASYYLASVADSVFMLPVDALNLVGLRAEVTFLAGTLDRVGIEPQIEKAGEYKNYPDLLTDTTLSPPHREAVETLLDDFYEQFVAAIAAGRSFSSDTVKGLIDRGPFTSIQAESLRLIDGRFYPHELERRIPSLFGERFGVVALTDYRAEGKYRDRWGEPPQIAVIAIDGGISRGNSRRNFFDGKQAGSATISAQVRSAAHKSDVKAIILRMNTGGGDAIAGDLIWSEVAEAAGLKPVLVSMSDVCASAGYYISSAANEIWLQPATVTGSIGVFAGKPNLDRFYRKLGMRTETIQRGQHAGIYSLRSGYTDEERAIVRRHVTDLYNNFVNLVSESRSLTADSVHTVARGRVWSGARAKEIGLADSFGSLVDVVEKAREKAGITDDDFVVVESPDRLWPWQLSALALQSLSRLVSPGDRDLLGSISRSLIPDEEVMFEMRLPHEITVK